MSVQCVAVFVAVLSLLALGGQRAASHRSFNTVVLLETSSEDSANVSMGDLDGDGDLDLVLAKGRHTPLLDRVLLNDAKGGFVASDLGPTADRTYTAALADLDGDGDLDALVGTFDGNSTFFENTATAGSPSFAAPSSNPFGLARVAYLAAPAFADIDGDGDLDVLVGHSQGDTILFENTGAANAPAFASPSSNPFGLASVANPAPAFADIDGDGDLDAFVAERYLYGDTIFFENTGTASAPAFGAPERNAFGLVRSATTTGPAFIDLDGDGDLDASLGGGSGNAVYFANTGSATAPAFAAPSTNPFGLADVPRRAAPAFADLDGDGDLDALVGDYYGDTFLFENRFLGPESCTDGIDNDLDAKVDFGSDPGCASEVDTDERSDLACDDGIDNDGDGWIDSRNDPGCTSASNPDENGAPVAVCRDVAIPTTPGLCGASGVSVDGGSVDPDGDWLDPVQSPLGPYALGTTAVALQVTDLSGESDSCLALVTVTDETPPAIDCGPATLPRQHGPACLPWSAADSCSLASATTSAPECFVVKKNGRRVERPCDLLAPADLSFRELPKKKTHVTWTVTARDAAGNEAIGHCETVIGKR
jgi:hypothetical protein